MKKPYEGHEVVYRWMRKKGILVWGQKGSETTGNTSNAAPQREMEVFGDPLEKIWKDCVFGLCGDSFAARQGV